jgi:hypothetical protein
MNTVTKLIPIDTRKHKELYDVFLATKLDDGATPTFLMRSTLHNLANIYWLRKEAIQRLLRETGADAVKLPAVCFLYGLKGLEEHEYIFVFRATDKLGVELK